MRKRILLIFLFFGYVAHSTTAQDIFRTACRGNIERLDSLLKTKDINVQDDRGRTLLHWAIGCDRMEVFEYLMQKGIDHDVKDEEEKTALHLAVRFQNREIFEKLVKTYQLDDWKKEYAGGLYETAIVSQSLAFVQLLIDSGVDYEQKNTRGSTPLEIAQRVGVQEIIDLLEKAGADVKRVRKFDLKGNYLGQTPPGKTPKRFAPNFISTEEQEFGSVFNAEGNEFYYGAHILNKSEIKASYLIEGHWTKPSVLIADSVYNYNDPFLSNDEQRLYFISNRTETGRGDPKDVDIWFVEKNEEGWSSPKNPGGVINSQGDEYYISFTQNGTMYFSSDGRAGLSESERNHDIYFSTMKNGEFEKAIRLGDSINTDAYEADVFIAPDESYIIFCSTREGGYGQGDLYICFKNNEGGWSKAKNMGDKINTHYYEYCPYVTKDGKYFFYTSNQDIYWVSTEVFLSSE